MRTLGKCGAHMERKTSNVVARIEPNFKTQAEHILGELGIPVSTAINLFFQQIAHTGGLPFPVVLPRAEGQSAVHHVRRSSPKEFLDNLFCEDCLETMQRMPQMVDVILTSPPYNTNAKAYGKLTLSSAPQTDFYPHLRYDSYSDGIDAEEYCQWTKSLFLAFDSVLKSNGVVLYNLNYGAENTEGMFRAVNTILTETPFTIADVIVWRKSRAVPNNVSPNRLTRIMEFVFVFCRKEEAKTFHCNKEVSGIRSDGQAVYHNLYNFLQAPNKSEDCPYNKAVYSEELCDKLLSIYAPPGAVVYDSFMGSGTTAVACLRRGLHFIGSEISEKQCDWAIDRIERVWGQGGGFPETQ